jgi:deoxyribodipyrimidine photolyase-like uncharacterized protein
MKNTKALVMACAVVFFASTANAQTTRPEESGKPIERQDGTLDFQKLSDRQLDEFLANQTSLLNRQILTMTHALLVSMSNTKSLKPNEASTMLFQSMEQGKVFLRTIDGWTPDDPKARKALEQMLQVDPAPTR